MTAAPAQRFLVMLTGGPLDGCHVRVTADAAQILVPGNRGRYVADSVGGRWYWELDHQ